MTMNFPTSGRSGKAGYRIGGNSTTCEAAWAEELVSNASAGMAPMAGGALLGGAMAAVGPRNDRKSPCDECMTGTSATACGTVRPHAFVSSVREYFCRDPRLLLTSYTNVCTRDKIYRQRTDGASLMQGGGMKAQIVRKVLHAVVLACLLYPMPALAENAYVGTAACKDCHEEQYDNFTKYAKKAHSDRSIKIMASDLTEAELAECYGCHTTGYGKPGGFVSYEKTPHVADAGCEVCHGPGREHVESGGDTGLIKGKLTMEDCQGCHNESRVKAFNFKPLLYGGAH